MGKYKGDAPQHPFVHPFLGQWPDDFHGRKYVDVEQPVHKDHFVRPHKLDSKNSRRMNVVADMRVGGGQEGSQVFADAFQAAQIAHPHQMSFRIGAGFSRGFQPLRIYVGEQKLPGRSKFLGNAPAKAGGSPGDERIGFVHGPIR